MNKQRKKKITQKEKAEIDREFITKRLNVRKREERVRKKA